MQEMNLVIICSDQHSKHILGCYGNDYVKTPALDKLAEEGVVFENAYCNSPLCVPSRASMAIGDYVSKHGYWDNAHAYAGKEKSWGTRLTEEGYSVTTIGKLHYFDDSPKTGFPCQKIPLHIKDKVGDIYGSIRDKEITRYQFREAIDNAGPGESDYQRYDIAIAEQTRNFLMSKREQGYGDKPFVLFVGLVAPHFPLTPPQEFYDLYSKRENLKIPIEFFKNEWPQHPVINDYRRYCGTDNLDEDTAWNAIRSYYALCSFMDAQVGKIMTALADSHLLENTRVIYTSDHGDTMGDHGVYYKSTMYEGSVGVPLIISGPDLPKGKKCKTNVSLVDIYPTVLEAVGIELTQEDKKLPGKSLFMYAKDKRDPNRVVFSEYYGQGIYTATFMLKKGDYKYIYYVEELPQLFDLKADPEERVDLASNPAYKPLIKELHEELSLIVDVEEMEKKSKEAQHKLVEAHGGKEEFLKNFKPSLFSPIPKLE